MSSIQRTSSIQKIMDTINPKKQNRKGSDTTIPFKMTHADAASLCTKVVQEYKGFPNVIDQKCDKIRKIYFSQ